jgi:hypothetical protein
MYSVQLRRGMRLTFSTEILILFLFFGDRDSLCSLGWPRTQDPCLSLNAGIIGKYYHSWILRFLFLTVAIVHIGLGGDGVKESEGGDPTQVGGCLHGTL